MRSSTGLVRVSKLGACSQCLSRLPASLHCLHREPREAGQMPLADGVNIFLTHTEGTNADLSPATSLEEGTTSILSAWRSSDCFLGFTSRCQCLSAVVAAKNIAVKDEVNCSCSLGPRAKICLKVLRTWEQPLSLRGFARSHVGKWQFSPQSYTLYSLCPRQVPASNFFSIAKYVQFSGLFWFTCSLPFGQFKLISFSFISFLFTP